MEKEQNIIKMEISDMMEIILMEKKKEMVNIYLKMVHILQVNLKIIYQMEKEQNITKMEISYMMEITLMEKKKEMVNIYLMMVYIIQVNLKII